MYLPRPISSCCCGPSTLRVNYPTHLLFDLHQTVSSRLNRTFRSCLAPVWASTLVLHYLPKAILSVCRKVVSNTSSHLILALLRRSVRIFITTEHDQQDHRSLAATHSTARSVMDDVTYGKPLTAGLFFNNSSHLILLSCFTGECHGYLWWRQRGRIIPQKCM